MRQVLVTIGAVVATPILTANAEGVAAIVRADPANTMAVFLGDRTVAPAGVGLKPGQAMTVFLGGGQDIWGISTAAGQLVAVLSAPTPSEFVTFGSQLVVGTGVAGTPAGGVLTVQGGNLGDTVPSSIAPVAVGGVGVAGYLRTLGVEQDTNISDNTYLPKGVLAALAVQVLVTNKNLSQWVLARTPNVFVPLAAVAINTETTVWTPAAGKRLRIMGYVITQTGASGNIVVKDNTAGTTILVIPAHTLGAVQVSGPMGNGILSAAANNPLTFTGIAAEVVSGYLFGTEE